MVEEKIGTKPQKARKPENQGKKMKMFPTKPNHQQILDAGGITTIKQTYMVKSVTNHDKIR